MIEKMSLEDNRENFSSKFGFIISCVGAALGLGNIWIFSYKLGTYGGAAFLICLLYTSPSPRDGLLSRMPSSA